MNDFETRFDPAPIVENTSKISIHPSRWSKMRFRKRDRAKKNLRFHEKKGVTRVNEFSFATKRWPRVESRRQAPLRAACSTRAPFRGAATRKNVNEEEEKMEYEERIGDIFGSRYRSVGLEIFCEEKRLMMKQIRVRFLYPRQRIN